MKRSLWLPLVVLFTLAARLAGAHAIGLSRGEWRSVPDGVEARLVFDRAELGALLAGGAIPEGSALDAAEAGALFASPAARAVVETSIVQRVRVVDGAGRPCPGALRELASSDAGGVTVGALYRCARPPAAQAVQIEFWDALTPGHRHLAATGSTGVAPAGGTAAPEQVVYERRPQLAIAPGAPRAEAESPSALGWLELGVEHIVGGYDHLLFLLALVLVVPALRTLVATVSIFTVAHSVTLALASFRLVVPPSSLVECAIALSITYVGLENLTPRASRPRFWIVLAFGLIHGFGFAGALAELGLPAASTPGALFAFNAGVELGQLAVLAVAFPIIQQLRRARWFVPRAVPALSLATALVGAIWFFERV